MQYTKEKETRKGSTIMLLRDRFWLWGHPEGRYNLNTDDYGCPDVSRMTPMEGCLYLGVRNTFMVPVGVPVNRRQYNKSFKTLRQVGWECFEAGKDPSKIEVVIEEAKDFPNIGCAVIDDFKCTDENGIMKYKSVPIENLQKVNDRLHNNGIRRLDSWMVLYCHQFGINLQADKEFQP